MTAELHTANPYLRASRDDPRRLSGGAGVASTRLPDRLMQVLVIAAISSISATAALAQPSSDLSTLLSTPQGRTQYLSGMCDGWRVSESTQGVPGRKHIAGKLTENACREIVEKWLPRYAEWYEAKDGSAILRAMFDVCRDIAVRLAGRPVEVVWCSSWNKIQGGRAIPHPGPPAEVWSALAGSPFEGIAVKKSSRDELLREVFERRLGKDWDQVRIRTDMEAIGFVCGVWNRRGERDLNITTTTPRFTCTGSVSEVVGAPSKPLFLFGLQINVSLKFAESGDPRGWQQIEVKTGEAHL